MFHKCFVLPKLIDTLIMLIFVKISACFFFISAMKKVLLIVVSHLDFINEKLQLL